LNSYFQELSDWAKANDPSVINFNFLSLFCISDILHDTNLTKTNSKYKFTISSLLVLHTYIISMTENVPRLETIKIQAIHGNSTFILVLPKDFVSELNIATDEYVKCKVSENQLVIEKLVE
jgi:predicted methyltransferase